MQTRTATVSRTRGAELALTAAKAAGVAATMVLAAKLRIAVPWSPVPITLQTFVALAAGATLGLGAGAGGVALYGALASAGLPVLAGPSLLGPTGGYVLGFVAAAAVAAAVAGRRPIPLLLGLLVGEALILGCGVAWLAAWTGADLNTAIRLGALPFLLGDGLKLIAAWAVASGWGAARAR
jgi:biotin transport system substrate-specific component